MVTGALCARKKSSTSIVQLPKFTALLVKIPTATAATRKIWEFIATDAQSRIVDIVQKRGPFRAQSVTTSTAAKALMSSREVYLAMLAQKRIVASAPRGP